MNILKYSACIPIAWLAAACHPSTDPAPNLPPADFVQDSTAPAHFSQIVESHQAPDGNVWCVGEGFGLSITGRGIENSYYDSFSYRAAPGFSLSMSDSYLFYPLLEDTGTKDYYHCRKGLVVSRYLGESAPVYFLGPTSREMHIDSLLGRPTNNYFNFIGHWRMPLQAFSASPHQTGQQERYRDEDYFPVYYCFSYVEGRKLRVALKKIDHSFGFIQKSRPLFDQTVVDMDGPDQDRIGAIHFAGHSFYITTDRKLLRLQIDGTLTQLLPDAYPTSIREMFTLSADTIAFYDEGQRRLVWSTDGGVIFTKFLRSEQLFGAKFFKIGAYTVTALNGQLSRISLADTVRWAPISSKGISFSDILGVYKIDSTVYVTTTAGIYRKSYQDFAATMPKLP